MEAGQLQLIDDLAGGYPVVRWIHFFAMSWDRRLVLVAGLTYTSCDDYRPSPCSSVARADHTMIPLNDNILVKNMEARATRRQLMTDLKPRLEKVERRLFLEQGLSLGALTMLAG